jgi:hypothetical protein
MAPDPRINERAGDAPPEEQAAGSADPAAQAAAILADSDERQASREGSGGDVEHRRPDGDRT